jgi:glyoxylase-like metal-dependent hydrolase (beta-lactamase superfamily II)
VSRLLSLLLLFISISFAVPKHVKETLKELSPGIYGVFGVYEQVSPKNRGFISNAYFIITRDGVIVFDALSTYKLGKELVETIQTKTKKPIKYLIISHYHTDHFYGAKAFKEKGAIIIAHPYALEYLGSDEAQRMFNARLGVLGKDLMKGTVQIAPDLLVDKSLVILLGGERFEIHHWCKAHTNGDLVLWIPSRKVLISGDIVFGGRVPFLGSGNSKSWIECLDKILELEPEVLLIGHGEPLFGKENIKRQVAWTKKYIQDIRSVVRKLYEEGLSVEEVRARANEEMLKIDPAYSQLPVFFDVNPVNAYHLYFEIEREVLFESK